MSEDYSPAPNLLNDRIILITGANRGIGACAAKMFAKHGATVVLLGRKQKELAQVYDEIVEAGHPQPAIIPFNLEIASPQDYQELASLLENEFGRLDGLLHNAATLGQMAPLENMNLTQWNRVMQVNLNAPLLLTHACIKLLKKSKDASIVFTSDEVGRKARAYWGAYAISKHAIEGMMQLLADELDKNNMIRVNTIDPGPVKTSLRKEAYPGEANDHLRDPEEIMNDYLYLFGPDSTGITGQSLTAQVKERDPALP